MERYPWAKKDLDIEYHDNEWGKAIYDDNLLFEMIIYKRRSSETFVEYNK